MKLVPTVYCKLLSNMEQVVFRMFPVNVFQIKTEGFTLSYSLWIAFAQQQCVIDFFTGADQAVS